MKFEVRPGGLACPVAPEILATELERVWEENGRKLLPGDVVDSASDPDSPIHECFEWRDDIAAHHYRLSQARGWIRRVVIVSDGGETQSVFTHVRITTDEAPPRSYYQRVTVLTVDEMRLAQQGLMRLLGAVESSLRELQAIANRDPKQKRALAKIALIQSALTTASTIAARLQ